MTRKELTKTSIFLVPALQIGEGRLTSNNFINGFLDDISHEVHYEDSIYILFKPEDLNKFHYFLQEERERITVIDDYDYEGGYVVVVYKLPDEFKEDMSKFLEGKYSSLSDDFKNRFKKDEKNLSIQWRVFTKDDSIRKLWEEELGVIIGKDSEVWGIPNFSDEILDIENIKKGGTK